MWTRPVVIDTPVLLNLLATGFASEILKAIPVPCFLCPVVRSETIYLRHPDPTQPHERVSLDPFVEAGTLLVTELETSAEEELYVQFAADLDDGEAMSLALCHARGYSLATDDRKARKLATELAPAAVPLLATSEMIQNWSEQVQLSTERLGNVIQAVERRARFVPGFGYPLKEWWERSRSLS